MRYTLILFTLLLLVGLALWFTSGPENVTRPHPNVVSRPAAELPPRELVAPPNTPVPAVTLASLSPLDRIKIDRDLSGLAIELLEKKAAATSVRSFDGTKLVLVSPALAITPQDLTQRLQQALTVAVGPARARELLATQSSRAELFSKIGADQLQVDSRFTFVKTKPEGDFEREGSDGLAKFEVTALYAGSSPAGAELKIKDFSYPDAYTIGLGWNAMAKAPQGYFRSQALYGVSSRPASVPWVFEEANSQTIEVKDLRYPGSTDQVPIKGG
jgi:hypothetical protein